MGYQPSWISSAFCAPPKRLTEVDLTSPRQEQHPSIINGQQLCEVVRNNTTDHAYPVPTHSTGIELVSKYASSRA